MVYLFHFLLFALLKIIDRVYHNWLFFKQIVNCIIWDLHHKIKIIKTEGKQHIGNPIDWKAHTLYEQWIHILCGTKMNAIIEDYENKIKLSKKLDITHDKLVNEYDSFISKLRKKIPGFFDLIT